MRERCKADLRSTRGFEMKGRNLTTLRNLTVKV